MIYECKLEGLVELGLRLFKRWDTYLLRPRTDLKLSTKRVIINSSNTFHTRSYGSAHRKTLIIGSKGKRSFPTRTPGSIRGVGRLSCPVAFDQWESDSNFFGRIGDGAGVDCGNPEGRLNRFKSFTSKRTS